MTHRISSLTTAMSWCHLIKRKRQVEDLVEKRDQTLCFPHGKLGMPISHKQMLKQLMDT